MHKNTHIEYIHWSGTPSKYINVIYSAFVIHQDVSLNILPKLKIRYLLASASLSLDSTWKDGVWMTHHHDRSQARRGVTRILILFRTGNKGENQTVLLHNVAKFNLCVVTARAFLFMYLYIFLPHCPQIAVHVFCGCRPVCIDGMEWSWVLKYLAKNSPECLIL